MKHFAAFLLVISSAVFLATCTATLRGVAPARMESFQGHEFTCTSDGLKIPSTHINDNYCDCADGSDEPGTSACSLVDQETKSFYCPNAGHQPTMIFRSQVDDGLCDCCDGSDEQEGVCANDCGAAAEKHAKEHKEREEKRQLGLLAKAELVAKARAVRAEKEAELAKLRVESATFDPDITVLEEKKRVEEEVELKEREAIKEESLKKKAEWELKKTEKIQPQPLACVGWRQTKDCKADGEREEANDLACEATVTRYASGYCECEGEKRFSFDCNHEAFNCTDVCTNQGLVTDEEFQLDEGTSHERQEAKQIREEISSKQNQKMEVEKKIGELEALLKEHSGPDDAFLTLRNECYSKDSGEYTYTLCLFREVTQKSRTNYGSSNLGRWKKFAEQTYSSWGGGVDYTKMIYEDGDHCWGGPIRSTTVHVVCGPTNEVHDIQEQSMCTYSMTFQTPAVCE